MEPLGKIVFDHCLSFEWLSQREPVFQAAGAAGAAGAGAGAERLERIGLERSGAGAGKIPPGAAPLRTLMPGHCDDQPEMWMSIHISQTKCDLNREGLGEMPFMSISQVSNTQSTHEQYSRSQPR
jgi:hypothetical protein